MTTLTTGSTQAHLEALDAALASFVPAAEQAARWGKELAVQLCAGARLIVAGNGGSAAQAQHLAGEIVGKYCNHRRAFSAVALHSEPASLTAILNDYGPNEVFARQVEAHGRPGDICVLLSTSGRSRNVVAAAQRARETGITTWAMTGRCPNPLANICDEVLEVAAPSTATVQELHLVALHILCETMDQELGV